jgi:hypothetical protein
MRSRGPAETGLRRWEMEGVGKSFLGLFLSDNKAFLA